MTLVAVAVALSFAVPTQTEAPAPAAAAASASFEVLGIKLTSAVENKEAVDEKTQFATGDKAWLWMKLKPTGDATLKLRWSLNGEAVYTMDPSTVRLGRTWYYKTLTKPGNWKVEVLDNADKVMATKEFTASGDAAPVKAATGAAKPTPAGDATAKVQPSATDSVSVVELKFAEKIQDRDPVQPAESFVKGSKVYTWMKLKVNQPEAQVKLRWLVDDKVIHTGDTVNVKQSTGWRTWQYKTVNNTGKWSVQVLDANGNVLHSAPFTVN